MPTDAPARCALAGQGVSWEGAVAVVPTTGIHPRGRKPSGRRRRQNGIWVERRYCRPYIGIKDLASRLHSKLDTKNVQSATNLSRYTSIFAADAASPPVERAHAKAKEERLGLVIVPAPPAPRGSWNARRGFNKIPWDMLAKWDSIDMLSALACPTSDRFQKCYC